MIYHALLGAINCAPTKALPNPASLGATWYEIIIPTTALSRLHAVDDGLRQAMGQLGGEKLNLQACATGQGGPQAGSLCHWEKVATPTPALPPQGEGV